MDCGSGDIASDSLNITDELDIDCGSGDIDLSTITAPKRQKIDLGFWRYYTDNGRNRKRL